MEVERMLIQLLLSKDCFFSVAVAVFSKISTSKIQAHVKMSK